MRTSRSAPTRENRYGRSGLPTAKPDHRWSGTSSRDAGPGDHYQRPVGLGHWQAAVQRDPTAGGAEHVSIGRARRRFVHLALRVTELREDRGGCGERLRVHHIELTQGVPAERGQLPPVEPVAHPVPVQRTPLSGAEPSTEAEPAQAQRRHLLPWGGQVETAAVPGERSGHHPVSYTHLR